MKNISNLNGFKNINAIRWRNMYVLAQNLNSTTFVHLIFKTYLLWGWFFMVIYVLFQYFKKRRELPWSWDGAIIFYASLCSGDSVTLWRFIRLFRNFFTGDSDFFDIGSRKLAQLLHRNECLLWYRVESSHMGSQVLPFSLYL